MKDAELIKGLIGNDPLIVHDFFFVRCRDTFTYIGQYFCNGMTAEEIIGEAYEVISADDWHKLKIFKFSSSPVTYVSVIIARHFQHKRDRLLSTGEEILTKMVGQEDNSVLSSLLMEDIDRTLTKFSHLDRILLQRILLDGEKPRDVMDEVMELILAEEGEAFVNGHTREQLSGYIYTRYSRVKTKFRNLMMECGYGN